MCHTGIFNKGKEPQRHEETKVSWKPGAEQRRETTNSSLLKEKPWCACTVLSAEPEAGPAVHALWYTSPCGCSLEHGLPVAWPVLGRDPLQRVEQEMVVAQGRERQVLGRREVHGRMRTKVHLRWFILQIGRKLV